MKCPECGAAEMIDFGNSKECQKCHFSMYFGQSLKKLTTEEDFDEEF
ncbi:hypothetical protein HYZ41_00930 [archaeon]|nr:hypothetical protein [archaeon]